LTSHNLVEPKSRLLLAITFEILALYRNLQSNTGKSSAALHPRLRRTGYEVDIILTH
jgi:hypothetical protein